MCFQNDGKSDQSEKFVKFRIMTKVIDSVLSINKYEQQCVVLKGLLKSLRLKYLVKSIGIDLSLSNNTLFEHKYIQNINKLYKHAGKCENQQQLKDILEAAMVYNPEGFTYNILDVKDKTAICQVRAYKIRVKFN